MNSGRIFTEPQSGEVNILPLFTEIEKNNCFSIQLFQKRLLLWSVMRDVWSMFHSPRCTMVDSYYGREFPVGNNGDREYLLESLITRKEICKRELSAQASAKIFKCERAKEFHNLISQWKIWCSHVRVWKSWNRVLRPSERDTLCY